MWIMGVCIPISIRSSLRRRESKWKIAAGIIRVSTKNIKAGVLGPVSTDKTRDVAYCVHRVRVRVV